MEEITNGYGIELVPITAVYMANDYYRIQTSFGVVLSCSDMDDYPTSASSSDSPRY